MPLSIDNIKRSLHDDERTFQPKKNDDYVGEVLWQHAKNIQKHDAPRRSILMRSLHLSAALC